MTSHTIYFTPIVPRLPPPVIILIASAALHIHMVYLQHVLSLYPVLFSNVLDYSHLYCYIFNSSPCSPDTVSRRKIRLVVGKAKCRHLLTCKETLRYVFICLRPRTPYPPLHTAYMYTVYLGGELNQREVKRGNSSQSWSKIPTWLIESKLW